MPYIADTEFCILDLETTGLRADRDHIIEFAALKIRDGEEIDRFSSLIDPGIIIPPSITELTGIDSEMVKGAPAFDEIILDIHNFLGDTVVVAHNVSFDCKFLEAAFEPQTEISFQNHRVCTCRLARRILPQLRCKNLMSVSGCLGIQNPAAHRALGDVLTTKEVFINMLQIIQTHAAIDTLENLLSFQRVSKKTAASLLQTSNSLQ